MKFEVLLKEEEIKNKVMELGKKITDDYRGKELILVGVLKGGVIFLADLVRNIEIPIEIDFIAVSSYGKETKSSGVVKILKDTDITITDKHVLIVEDIVDTGLTLQHLKNLFQTRLPKSVKICTIFDKPAKRVVDIDIDYNGIILEDKFVVGYGLDYSEKYRNLPHLCVLSDDNI